MMASRMKRSSLRNVHKELDSFLLDVGKDVPEKSSSSGNKSSQKPSEEKVSEWNRLRTLLLNGAINKHQRHEINLLITLLTSLIAAIGDGQRIRYRSVLALHIFKSSGSDPSDDEMTRARVGLFGDGNSYNFDALALVLQAIKRIRSIVGMKNLHEAVALVWNSIEGRPHLVPDPPILAPHSEILHSNDMLSLSGTARDVMNDLEIGLGLGTSFSEVEMETHDTRLDCVPVVPLWRNKEIEEGGGSANGMDAGVDSDSSDDEGPSTSAAGATDTMAVADLVVTVQSMFRADSDTILKSLFELITSERSDDDIQMELVELVGYDNFDMVENILSGRQQFREQIHEAKRLQVTGIANLAPEKLVPLQRNPAYCQQVVVQSKEEADIRKEIRREQKRNQRELNRLNHAFGEKDKLEIELAQREILRQRQLELERMRWNPSLKAVPLAKEAYPFVFDSSVHTAGTIIAVNGLKYALPEGSERIQHRDYEAVKVPPVKRDSVQDVKHIYIKDLDEIGQKGFAGFEKLNKIQSIVFEQAYKTKENLLICAPTGAGKTNIAMLTILNTIHQFTRHDGVIMKDEFKVIYIAPMKALATEMTESFGKRLAPLGLKVRELTGDTSLSKKEIEETQMLVLTPEKWDVVTRKTADNSLASLVRLLIIDEVHLLHDDRGPVIETIVARTLRQVEMAQQGIRIVGLSATLPNYVDVSRFLKVNPYKGLFFFDGRFRPVPLSQKFIGVKKPGSKLEALKAMDDICYDEVRDFVRRGHQVLVFVHARNATATLAEHFKMRAAKLGDLELFMPPKEKIETQSYVNSKKAMNSARSGQLNGFFQSGFGIHHAGLVRGDRITMEKIFGHGHISVLFCTATLAWGVNLPAHAVVIRGTEVFDAEKGAYADLGVLDVQQIFGRAGRPQFENEGHGIIITWQKSLDKYLGMLVRQAPIESQFLKRIHDNLNAEVALGTVSNVEEAVEWLKCSYFYIRALINPQSYAMKHNITLEDPDLSNFLTKKIEEVAEQLKNQKMIGYDSINGFLSATDLGRIASNFYIKYSTVEMLNDKEQAVKFEESMPDDQVLALISQATEFSQIKVREEEYGDLYELVHFGCLLPIRAGGILSIPGKVNCLLQCFISRSPVRSFSLMSETLYVQQNASRISRAFFEMALRQGWAYSTNALLTISKCIEKRMWPNQSPLRQLVPDYVTKEVVEKIELRMLTESQLFDLTPKELHNMFRYDGDKLFECIRMLPRVMVETVIRPITYTIVQVEAVITPCFHWNTRLLGKAGAQSFWVMLEDASKNMIVHQERIAINKKKVDLWEPQRIIFTIPIRDEQLANTFQLRVASDYFIIEDTLVPIVLNNRILPPTCQAHTTLLPLLPLPVATLRNDLFQSIYPFEFFNPIQTQVFFSLYHSDENVLLGAPTGSGKTCVAELAIFRLLSAHPGKKCVYIAPMKALVRERVADWKEKFEKRMGYKVIELSGDVTPDVATLNASSILIATPEKWDGITRSWATREYVRDVGLVIIDEIHLLGVDRGNVLEAIVTRLKLLTRRSCLRSQPARLIGLSTALANAGDVAAWLGITDSGLFNFRPAVRPVPINVHMKGFPGQHYCPRMALMNKPAFKEILTYSPTKPVIVFVASRRQTRLTAQAFINQLVTQHDPRLWLHCDHAELDEHVRGVRDEALKLCLPFGIGMHHAGLMPAERALVEHLFVEKKIQVLVATATLAWGINMPAHLVIVKGTEYFDGKTGKYVDFPVTDVLQMMGRAGRPQFDDSAVAVVYVQDSKKNFYKKFLFDPFPVESSLLPQLANHVNAEINAGTVTTKQGVMEYIAGTYLYRRLLVNPNYYGLEDLSEDSLTAYMNELVDSVISDLLKSNCIVIDEEEGSIHSSAFGRLASIYYLDHKSIRHLCHRMTPQASIQDLLSVLADMPEYSEIPVRHNEDEINAKLARGCRIRLDQRPMDSPHTKTHILYQTHFSRSELQTDYRTDQRSVIESCVRILQAMREYATLRGWMGVALSVVAMQQMAHTGRWWDDHPLLALPRLREADAIAIDPRGTVPLLQSQLKVQTATGTDEVVRRGKKMLSERTTLDGKEVEEVLRAIARWPIIVPVSLYIGDDRVDLLQSEKGFLNLSKGQPTTARMRIESRGPCRYEQSAVLPQWPKEKSAGWIVSIGVRDTNQLLGCAVVGPVSGSARATLHFVAPDTAGFVDLLVVIQSDCYTGLDQEYTVAAFVG